LVRIHLPLPKALAKLPGLSAFMEFVTYILYSSGSDRNYTGITSNLLYRFKSHNLFGKDGTAKYRPWIVVHVEFFASRPEALKREKYFKSGRGSILKNQIIKEYIARWAHTLP
jgi:putative endonuclease